MNASGIITEYPEALHARMSVFIDTDKTGISPSWEGFEYVINRDGDIPDFYKSGDAAPGGRFTFVY